MESTNYKERLNRLKSSWLYPGAIYNAIQEKLNLIFDMDHWEYELHYSQSDTFPNDMINNVDEYGIDVEYDVTMWFEDEDKEPIKVFYSITDVEILPDDTEEVVVKIHKIIPYSKLQESVKPIKHIIKEQLSHTVVSRLRKYFYGTLLRLSDNGYSGNVESAYEELEWVYPIKDIKKDVVSGWGVLVVGNDEEYYPHELPEIKQMYNLLGNWDLVKEYANEFWNELTELYGNSHISEGDLRDFVIQQANG